jgi:hypothetical protein
LLFLWPWPIGAVRILPASGRRPAGRCLWSPFLRFRSR